MGGGGKREAEVREGERERKEGRDGGRKAKQSAGVSNSCSEDILVCLLLL